MHSLVMASLTALPFFHFHHTPWLLIGLVLAAALVSRGLMFVLAMFRHKD